MLEHRLMENVAGASAIIDRAGIEPGMRVLDAGCGPGRVTIPIARYVGSEGEVVALDVQESMLEHLSKRVREAQLNNITPLLASLGGGMLEVEEFDRAIMVTVLGEIPDRKAALREIFYTLKPGGILSITEVLPDPHYQSQKLISALAEEVGFQAEKVYSSFRSYTMNLIRPNVAYPFAGADRGCGTICE
jgi:ubiquinone/menaquinone biosynthesis C-methylase UbiE